MIVSVFTPSGIITATASVDIFIESKMDSEDNVAQKDIRIEGLPHTYIFWDKYVLTYKMLNQNIYEHKIIQELNNLTSKWDSRPPICEFMPYVKKMIMDTHIQFIGILSGYDANELGILEPYVYQVLGESVRRINISNDNSVNYNCVYLERKPIVGKLFQSTKLRNGDEWEDTENVNLRCDIFSIKKSIDLCSFMIKTNYFMENLNTTNYSNVLPVDVTITTLDKIESKTINI